MRRIDKSVETLAMDGTAKVAAVLVVLAGLILSSGCQTGSGQAKPRRASPAAASAETVPKSLKDDLIIPGRRVTITVAEDPSLNREYLINPGGQIEYPPLGRVMVEGLRTGELARLIQRGLEADYFKHATVEVQVESGASLGKTIWVIPHGERAFLLSWHEGLTVSELMRSLGQDPGAVELSLIRSTDDGKRFKLDLRDDPMSGVIPLQPGDAISYRRK